MKTDNRSEVMVQIFNTAKGLHQNLKTRRFSFIVNRGLSTLF